MYSAFVVCFGVLLLVWNTMKMAKLLFRMYSAFVVGFGVLLLVCKDIQAKGSGRTPKPTTNAEYILNKKMPFSLYSRLAEELQSTLQTQNTF